MKRGLLIIFLVLILIPSVNALEGYMPLLAISERADGFVGSKADLYVDIRAGSGRVYIDTYPLSKIDTQISTRFARDIACDFLNLDCSNLDFLYAITAKTPIIGGPSAGAAISALTAALLLDLEVKPGVAITGTINSGSVLGPVGGVKEKIDAAANYGMNTVVIPESNQYVSQSGSNLDLINYGRGKGVRVVAVSELNDALYFLTGVEVSSENGEINLSSEYEEIMEEIAQDLCMRNTELALSFIDSINSSELIAAKNLRLKAENSLNNTEFYSAASYCFGSNIKYRYLLILNKTLEGVINTSYEVKSEIERFKNKDFVLETIIDLQALMVVHERLDDASESVNKALVGLINLNNEDAFKDLAYAIERLYSAQTWAKFFNRGGQKYDLNLKKLEDSCIKKINEAEERYQYAKTFLGSKINNIRESIETATKAGDGHDFALCLYTASEAKANANAILSTIGVETTQVDDLLRSKLAVVKKSIIRAHNKGAFPIIGYSYYEYANSLKDSAKFSALLYAEYALELTNLDFYFEDRQKKVLMLGEEINLAVTFIIGVVIGVFISIFIFRKQNFLKR